MFTLQNKTASLWSEDIAGSFMDAYRRAHGLLCQTDDLLESNHDCIVIWAGNRRVAEVRYSRRWSWMHADYRDQLV